MAGKKRYSKARVGAVPRRIEIGLSDRKKRTPADPRMSTLIGLCRELDGRIDLAYPGGVTIVFEAAATD